MINQNSNQFLKFIVVGGLNTAIDFLTLNILLLISPPSTTFVYALYKALSFCIACINSFYFNRQWVFRSSSTMNKKNSEITKFAGISLVGLGINTIVSYFIFSIGVLFLPSIPHVIIANLGALIGTVVVFLWNFTGYKFFVFSRQKINI